MRCRFFDDADNFRLPLLDFDFSINGGAREIGNWIVLYLFLIQPVVNEFGRPQYNILF